MLQGTSFGSPLWKQCGSGHRHLYPVHLLLLNKSPKIGNIVPYGHFGILRSRSGRTSGPSRFSRMARWRRAVSTALEGSGSSRSTEAGLRAKRGVEQPALVRLGLFGNGSLDFSFWETGEIFHWTHTFFTLAESLQQPSGPLSLSGSFPRHQLAHRLQGEVAGHGQAQERLTLKHQDLNLVVCLFAFSWGGGSIPIGYIYIYIIFVSRGRKSKWRKRRD